MQLNVKEQTIIKTHLKVAKVVDGDGIIVTNLFNKQEEEIRLLGIDAISNILQGCAMRCNRVQRYNIRYNKTSFSLHFVAPN